MSNKSKSTWMNNLLALGILAGIGVTFVFLYAFHDFSSTQNECTELEGLRNILTCSQNFSYNLMLMQKASKPRAEENSEQMCKLWAQYLDCKESVFGGCETDQLYLLPNDNVDFLLQFLCPMGNKTAT